MSDSVIVELTDAGPQRIRGNGQTYEPGDRREVSVQHADALPDYWRVVETDDSDECPFCDAYEGANVAQHASQAHPDEWADYSED